MYQVSKIATTNMGISAAVAILLPIVLLILWIRKKKVRIAPFFWGALTFVVFVLVLESICHQFFLVKDSALSRFINGNIWAYVLYASLAAGIFEETGRFIVFKLLLRRDGKKETAVTYGIGHGGIEAILLVGVSMLSYMILASTLNSLGGIDQYLALFPAESQELMKATVMPLYTTPPYIYLMGSIERVITIVFHIALSVLVFMAAKRPGKLYFYPAAIAFHAFFDVFAALYQKGIITNIVLMEVILLAITAAVAFFTWRLYQNDSFSDAKERQETSVGQM